MTLPDLPEELWVKIFIQYHWLKYIEWEKTLPEDVQDWADWGMYTSYYPFELGEMTFEDVFQKPFHFANISQQDVQEAYAQIFKIPEKVYVQKTLLEYFSKKNP